MYEKVKLKYEFDGLQPYIDSRTIEIHYGKHHQTYLDKFVDAVKGTSFDGHPIEEILKNESDLPENIRKIVHNNGGGFYNHNIYFDGMCSGGSQISEFFNNKIIQDFGGFDDFKTLFSNLALNQFGSGRACLAKRGDKLVAYGLANQDTAIALGDIPLLMLDVWEHAYYLNYQNLRAEYVKNWWNVVDWKKVEELYNN